MDMKKCLWRRKNYKAEKGIEKLLNGQKSKGIETGNICIVEVLQ